MPGSRKPTGRRIPRPSTLARRARREQALLEKLEELRRAGTPTWPSDFARRVGLKDKSALRLYPVLSQELRQYALKTAPGKMRTGKRDSLRSGISEAALREAGAERDHLQAEVERLTRQLDEARTQLEEERQAHATTRVEMSQARAMVDALDEYLVRSDVGRARDIERGLHRLAAAITGAPLREVPPAPEPEGRHAVPHLTVIQGGLSEQAHHDAERSS